MFQNILIGSVSAAFEIDQDWSRRENTFQNNHLNESFWGIIVAAYNNSQKCGILQLNPTIKILADTGCQNGDHQGDH